MKIVTFKYNKSASAIRQQTDDYTKIDDSRTLKFFIGSITNNMDDRSNWEEVFSPDAKSSQEFLIPGSWQ